MSIHHQADTLFRLLAADEALTGTAMRRADTTEPGYSDLAAAGRNTSISRH